MLLPEEPPPHGFQTAGYLSLYERNPRLGRKSFVPRDAPSLEETLHMAIHHTSDTSAVPATADEFDFPTQSP